MRRNRKRRPPFFPSAWEAGPAPGPGREAGMEPDLESVCEGLALIYGKRNACVRFDETTGGRMVLLRSYGGDAAPRGDGSRTLRKPVSED